MKQKARETFLAEWQKILRLQDWEITVQFVRGHEIDGDQAWISHEENHKRATIRLRDPVDLISKDWSEDSPETSLVHELLHLHILPFGRTEPRTRDRVCVEQAIELITGALIGLKRRADAKEP